MIVIYYENELREIEEAEITYSTQHPNFPATNLKNRLIGEPWRSQYGSGSGGGRFLIEAGVNDRLDFTDSAAAAVTALLTPGIYNADTLAAHIVIQMDAVSVDNFTVYLIESGVNIFHWFIESDDTGGGGTITLRWNTGANTARSIGTHIGYSDAADDAGALFYVSDFVAIHTEEFVDFDLGAALPLRGFFTRRHNLEVGAISQIWADNNAAFPAGIKLNFQRNDDYLVRIYDAAVNYQYVRFYIQDPTNADGFVELGVASAGDEFRADRNFAPGRTIGLHDPSLVLKSTGGQKTSVQLERFKNHPYLFIGSAQRAQFEAFQEHVGYSLPFFYVENDEDELATARYVTLSNMRIKEFAGGTKFNIDIDLEDEI